MSYSLMNQPPFLGERERLSTLVLRSFHSAISIAHKTNQIRDVTPPCINLLLKVSRTGTSLFVQDHWTTCVLLCFACGTNSVRNGPLLGIIQSDWAAGIPASLPQGGRLIHETSLYCQISQWRAIDSWSNNVCTLNHKLISQTVWYLLQL